MRHDDVRYRHLQESLVPIFQNGSNVITTVWSCYTKTMKYSYWLCCRTRTRTRTKTEAKTKPNSFCTRLYVSLCSLSRSIFYYFMLISLCSTYTTLHQPNKKEEKKCVLKSQIQKHTLTQTVKYAIFPYKSSIRQLCMVTTFPMWVKSSCCV